MGSLVDLARKMRPYIEKAAQALDDQDASNAPTLLRGMRYDGALIASGTRINWRGTVKRAAVDLWDMEENDPDHAPELWEDIGYRDGIRVIPETITAGMAFSEGELGWWGDVLYVSLIDNNVWTPDQYGAGWAKNNM